MGGVGLWKRRGWGLGRGGGGVWEEEGVGFGKRRGWVWEEEGVGLGRGRERGWGRGRAVEAYEDGVCNLPGQLNRWRDYFYYVRFIIAFLRVFCTIACNVCSALWYVKALHPVMVIYVYYD